MRFRRSAFLFIVLFTIVVGSIGPTVLQAQDRGARRFSAVGQEDTSRADLSYAGRLWSLARPPFERLESRYGIAADSGWAEHVRRGLLRLPSCTGALVSAEGLAMTTAECVRRVMDSEGADGAFVATDPGAEQSLGIHVDRLVGATDVTETVRTVETRSDSTLQEAMAAVQARLQSEAGAEQRVEVESGAGGATFTAYTYRRYGDVRLVFLPEQSLSSFGGLDADLTYPRHAFDVALLRVYTEEGEPLAPDHYFEPAAEGIRPGDTVLSLGFGTATRRNATTEQLKFDREVVLPLRRSQLETWIRATESNADLTSSSSTNDGHTLRMSRRQLKKIVAKHGALQNESIVSRLRRRDEGLRHALETPGMKQRFGGVMDSLAAIQRRKDSLASAYRAFGPPSVSRYRSSTLRRALLATDGSSGQSLWQELPAMASQPNAVDAALLADRLRALETYLYPDTAAVRTMLGGMSAEERAMSVVENSVLSDLERLRALRQKGASLPTDDPALELVGVFSDQYRTFREAWHDLTQTEARLTRRLARARDAVRNAPVLSASPGAPRLTDGRVLGYPYNGTMAPPFTTLFGLYGQARSFSGERDWTLPDRWTSASTSLNRSLPLNLATSTDPAVGTSGGPLLNRHLEIVGLAFDTNIQAVGGAYLFLPDRMRTVSLDLRTLRQALLTVYDARPLVGELFGGSGSDTTRP